MANLIEQMNVLKGLRDEDLQAEIQSPSGAAPPFLVLTEIERRKGMRDRYAAEQARRAPRTTVVEDLAGGLPQAAMPGAVPSMPTVAPVSQRQFANGGIVDAVDYSDIARRYNERLSGLEERADRARALALIAAGAGIMGGGSSNTLRNVGTGISAAVPMYQDQLQTIDTEELNLLRGLTDIGQAEQQGELAQLDRQLRERELELSEQRLTTERKPADVLAFEYYRGLDDEGRRLYDERNPPYNPNAMTNDLRRLDQANEAFDQALKSLPEPMFIEPGKEQEIARERQKQAAILAYPKWVALLGTEGAAAMARQYGLSEGDIVLGGAPASGAFDAGGVNEKDPLGLGL